jgi:2'-5' RNA ligase
MRVFISVDPDEATKKEIEKLLKNLAKKHWAVKWEAIEKIHITLAFLGEISQSQILNLNSQIDNLNLKSFTLSFKGLGCFPDYDWPRIIWLGLKGDLKSLVILQKEIETRLLRAGFNLGSNPPNIPDASLGVFRRVPLRKFRRARPFVPHITIGRIKNCSPGQRKEIARQVKAMQKMDFKSVWQVDKVIIYESKLSQEGSVYSQLFYKNLK